MGLKFTGPKPIKGTACTIGKFYRRESQPTKVYLCVRHRDYDKYRNQDDRIIYQGRTLASLEHGELLTNSDSGSLNLVDFIEVTIDGKYTDVL